MGQKRGVIGRAYVLLGTPPGDRRDRLRTGNLVQAGAPFLADAVHSLAIVSSGAVGARSSTDSFSMTGSSTLGTYSETSFGSRSAFPAAPYLL